VPIEIFPEAGQFSTASAPPSGLVVSYQYGFPATIGAGPYDRSLLANPPAPFDPVVTVSGGRGLDAALNTAAGNGTIEIGDSRTYTSVLTPDATPSQVKSLLVQAGDLSRPVIRLAPPAAGSPPAAWTFTGGGDELPSLTLDGLLFSGGDIVLQGAFASVRLTAFTADPGTAGGGESGFATAVDGQTLAPTTIWIEADPNAKEGDPNTIELLQIDHCLLGPIRTRNGGSVQSVTIADTIVQGLAPAPLQAGSLTSAEVYDPGLLASVLGSSWTPAQELFALLPAAAQAAIKSYTGGVLSPTSLTAILDGLNGLIQGSAQLGVAAPAVAGVPIGPDLAAALAAGAAGDVPAINRALLEATFPVALAPAALAFDAGSVALERVSVIGSAFLHRLAASDSVLTGFSVVQDAQHGCVRYSAVSSGSYTPRQFSAAQLAPSASLFTSTDFGAPGYAQLLETVDRAIFSAPTGVTISSGAENGSEMGAYCGSLAPIKERGLLIKYDEYMPLGLTPVIVHVT
jgi:hypothetical protein